MIPAGWIVFREGEQFAVLISISTLALGSAFFVIIGWLMAVFVCKSTSTEATGDKLCAVLVSVDIVL